MLHFYYMNLNNANEMVSTSPTDPVVNQPHPVNQVTTFSKYLAMVLFVALPFIGAYVGHQLGAQKETITSALENNISAGNSFSEELMPSTDAVSYEIDQTSVENYNNEINSYYSTTTLRYVEANQDTSDFWANPNNYTNSKVITGVTFVDLEAQKISSKPFLRILQSAPYGFILTLPCFIESECGDGGLFKYDKVKKEVTSMKGSKYFYPMMTGNYRSPDGSKIAVAYMFTLGVIDLINDEYTEIHKFDYKEHKTFSICEMGCYSDLKWSGSDTLFAQVFEFEKCNSEGSCESPYIMPSGETIRSRIPTSSSSVKYTF